MLNGLVLVNKPTGITSHDLVARARRVFKTKAVGHCGTLDPLATGLMVLLLNEATKLSQYILEGNKAYQVQAKFGVETDTFDVTGSPVREVPLSHNKEDVLSQANRLEGEFNWSVPVFSAIKVGGEKLYEKARRGEEFEAPKKHMKFWGIKFLGGDLPYLSWEIHCSKGSYIRTWVHEFGHSLGSAATMSALNRIYSAPFGLENAMSLEEIENQLNQGVGELKCIVPIELALPSVKRIRIKGQDEKLLKNGGISHDLRTQLIQSFQPGVDEVIQIQSLGSGKLLALIGLNPGVGFAIKRVFQY